MHRQIFRGISAIALCAPLACVFAPATAQVSLPGGGTVITPTQSPAAAALTAATQVHEASVREVYGVDTTSSCDMLLPTGEANPVLYRRASAAPGASMEVFTGDTGLVLSGRDFSLLQSAVLRIPGSPAVQGTIVRRRLASSQCGETPGNDAGVVVIRFAIPALTTRTLGTLEMKTRRTYPPLAFKVTPCTPAAMAGVPEAGIGNLAHCFPDLEFDVPAIPIALVPRPRITGLTAGMQTDGVASQRLGPAGQIEMVATLVGTGLSRLNAMRREELPGSAPGMALRNFTFGIASPSAILSWFGAVPGQVARGRVRGSVPMLRFPRGSGAGLATAVRDTIDTAWAGSAGDLLRSMGEGTYAITALAAAAAPPPPPPPVTIKGFDPGNLLFASGGGTTTVANSGVSATMVGLASESWCSTVPQPNPGAGGVRVVAQGTATLAALSWGIRNEGTAAFNGSITAELRLRGRVVDTLTFTGALQPSETKIRAFARPVTQVTVARESLGPKCFYVGNTGDAVLENGAYEIKVVTPAANSRTLVSLP